jgi:membrane protein DedA with SNARE-associated domain
MFSGFLDLEAQIRPLVEFLRTHQEWILPVVFLIAFGECTAFLSFLIPATVFFSLFGAYAGATGLNLFPIALSASLGAGFGFWFSYWIGQRFGPAATQMWPLKNNPQTVQRGHDFFEKWGMAGIFLGHFIGPVRAVIGLVAGMVAMPFIPFQLANWAASFAWGFGLTYAGAMIGEKAAMF